MATGLNDYERTEKNSIIAGSVTKDPFPLPNNEGDVFLDYDHKVSYKKLLELDIHSYQACSPNGFFRPVKTLSHNSLIWGDNLFVMRSLLETHRKGFRLIYLDPPYGTGMDFHGRDQKHAYCDKMSSAMYVEYIRRRLLLMKELLSNDGSIYVHIGHQMLFHMKLVMDEIFGSQCFRNLIVRRKCSSKNYTKCQYPNLHDYILFYTKSSEYVWNQPKIAPDDAWVKREYPKNDTKGRFKLVPIHAPGVRNGESGRAWRGMMPPPGKHWQILPAKLDALDASGEIHWSKNGNPRRKVYWSPDKHPSLTDYWGDYRDAHHQSTPITGYPTEKNLSLLETIIQASSNPGDLVLDPFVGSGTTAHAARNLGRKWIGIDQSMQSILTCVYRFQYGLQAMGDFVRKTSSKKGFLLKPPCPKTCDYTLAVDSHVFLKHNKDIPSFFDSTH